LAFGAEGQEARLPSAAVFSAIASMRVGETNGTT
jgi:hypothetical protein